MEQDAAKRVKEQTEQNRRLEIKKQSEHERPAEVKKHAGIKQADSRQQGNRQPESRPIMMTCDADGILSSIFTFISFVVAVVCFLIYCFCFCYVAFDDDGLSRL